MVKHTQAIRWLLSMSGLSVFDHFVGLALKGLMKGIIGHQIADLLYLLYNFI